jgi:metal-responsive CopG/Arc/MetJ family transcriptional regulator
LVQDYKVIPFDDRNIAVIITILKGDEKEIDNFTGDLGTMKGIIIKTAVEMK